MVPTGPQRGAYATLAPFGDHNAWVAIEELKLTYHNSGTILFTTYPYYGNVEKSLTKTQSFGIIPQSADSRPPWGRPPTHPSAPLPPLPWEAPWDPGSEGCQIAPEVDPIVSCQNVYINIYIYIKYIYIYNDITQYSIVE